jgi:type I restriction enzyme M protein
MSEHKFLQDLDKKLWISANKLLPSLDAAVYKHVVLGMVFVKYVSDSFEARRDELKQDFSDPEHDYFLGDDADDDFINDELENRDYYQEKNIFWVPQAARWQYLQDNIRLSSGSPLALGGEFKGTGRLLDDTMVLIEKENPKLKRLLKKDYAQLQIEESKLADLLDLIATIPFSHGTLGSKDILGHVYEYFLGQFASAEGKKGGQFYTPKSIVNLMVEMCEPYKGRVYDPAMGSGGFFISSEKFIEEHQGKIGDISVYGQESNPTTWRLAAMNMAIRGIDFNFGNNAGDTFTNDQHPDLRADFVLANPPFNQDEWWDGSLEGDARWKYGTPPKGNGNYAWVQHMLHHTSPNGLVGLVLSNGSLSSNTGGEGDIRKALVNADLVEAIVALPSQLFSNTQIPACIWLLNKNKVKKGKTLFIDARETGYMLDRKQRAFNEEDIKGITDTFHAFRKGEGYEDILGQYYEATAEEIAKQEHVLTPGRYVGFAEEEDDGVPFAEKMQGLTGMLKEQFEESARLEEEIKKSLAGLGYEV